MKESTGIIAQTIGDSTISRYYSTDSVCDWHIIPVLGVWIAECTSDMCSVPLAFPLWC